MAVKVAPALGPSETEIAKLADSPVTVLFSESFTVMVISVASPAVPSGTVAVVLAATPAPSVISKLLLVAVMAGSEPSSSAVSV